ncbi:helix-turn-helix domain-containing protein [Streptomyces xiamenensis]|uniref:helix-turn-helix domain-containing protein n=1 Tax=Streptomyces xiamenensis TaxID=408015 RepID=UPI00367A5902
MTDRGAAGADADADAFIAGVAPLVDAIGGELIAPAGAGPEDVVLFWAGREAVAVRLPALSGSLDHLLSELRRRHGMPLADLDRSTKQQVVRTLEARGAFAMRHGVETVAGALGVSRFTVYNYLNREQGG